MIKFLKRLMDRNDDADDGPIIAPTDAPPRPTPAQKATANDVIRRRKMVREDTGTHETLKIVDDELEIADDSDGIDPYNTGGFDRSKNWDSRFRK